MTTTTRIAYVLTGLSLFLAWDSARDLATQATTPEIETSASPFQVDVLDPSSAWTKWQSCVERQPDPLVDHCFDLWVSYPDTWIIGLGADPSDRVTVTFGELRQLIRDWQAHADHADGPH